MKKPFDIEAWAKQHQNIIVVVVQHGVVQDVLNTQYVQIIDYDDIEQNGECPFCSSQLTFGRESEGYPIICEHCGWVETWIS